MTFSIEIHTQPDDETCGPTSLHAVYHYFGYDYPLTKLIDEIPSVANGGTITPHLGIHALEHHFDATIYAYNPNIFDPTWFHPKPVSMSKLTELLCQQLAYKDEPKLREAIKTYQEFIQLGGKVVSKDLTVSVLKHYFNQKLPIITALSATYLYRSARERDLGGGKTIDDPIRGVPVGHFVVLSDYDEHHRRVIVADPHRENPLSHDNYYKVSSHRLINSIMLGVLTYDANLLIISPKDGYHSKCNESS